MHMNAANGTLIAGVAVQFGENFEIDGAVTINHARGIDLEGIVSERKRLSRCLGHVIFTHRPSEQNRTPRRRYSETRLSVGGIPAIPLQLWEANFFGRRAGRLHSME
jgi:hypothetical protein